MSQEHEDELGWEDMDRQHGDLRNLFTSLADAPRDRERDLEALRRIEVALAEHFSWEEHQMREAGYPDSHLHGLDHHRQLLNLQDLDKTIGKGGEGLDADFFSACLGWLGRHVRSMDWEFAQFRHDREIWELRHDLGEWETCSILEAHQD